MTQKAAVTINKFVGGLITDASPLTFPDNTSAVDINMDLNIDGSRKRALGIDYETGYSIVSTSVTPSGISNNSYRWENVAGNSATVILCVQFGNQVKFFYLDTFPISTQLITTHDFSGASPSQRFSFAAVDGNLVITTGEPTITTVSLVSGSLVFATDTIKVRDFFGVEDTFGGDDLTLGNGLQTRPTTLSPQHIYNLRNQSFGIPRINGNVETFTDCIDAFSAEHLVLKAVTKYPSNADNVQDFLYADATDNDDRNSKRYFAADAIKNPLGTTRAPQGYYVIDLLQRGTDRYAADVKNHFTNYPELTNTFGPTDLPADTTSGGASVVGEFAGRVFYAGFNGVVTGGDSKSPKLNSYVAFSQLVSNPSLSTRCYQAGDPTSDKEADIIDTDGGFIRLNNAYNIVSLTNLGKSLFVGASNGVWRIYGGNDSGFSATNYAVEKITDKGVIAQGSVVVIENTMMYWSEDGIYHLQQNQYGDWASVNQTQAKIQRFYNEITLENKSTVSGVFDSYQRKVKWLYNNSLNDINQQKELILDVNLGAFYERWISQVNGDAPPILASSFKTNVFHLSDDLNNTYQIGYVVVTQTIPTISYTFASYKDEAFLDWKSFDGVGVDAPATLITGQASGGDNMRYKQIPYLWVHMKRTEDLNTGTASPTYLSSCYIQSVWDWTNSIISNKWGTPFQAYRYRRIYPLDSISGDPNSGYELLITKNKLRGRGRAISLMFTSSPGKEMYIYGWSLIMSVNDNG